MLEHVVFPDLKNKTIAITGGASGIGAAIVRAFHQQGSQIVFFDIDEKSGSALSLELGENVSFVRLDITNLSALKAEFNKAAERVGDFDVLVNNAAHDERHNIEDVTHEYWRNRLAVNLDHHFFAAQSVVKGMKAKGEGAIVNLGSTSWLVGLENASAYVTAKAAIQGLTNGLARDLGPSGIRVNCLLPGFVRTKRQVDKWLTPELHEAVMLNQCLKKFIEPNDVASMVVMLASNTARAVTKQSFIVDAGWS